MCFSTNIWLQLISAPNSSGLYQKEKNFTYNVLHENKILGRRLMPEERNFFKVGKNREISLCSLVKISFVIQQLFVVIGWLYLGCYFVCSLNSYDLFSFPRFLLLLCLRRCPSIFFFCLPWTWQKNGKSCCCSAVK